MEKWRFIDTGISSAPWNMAVDEALLSLYHEGDYPVFRLYGWKSALSFGRFTKPEKSVDLEKIAKNGIQCVRRMTGGGILVHGGDLSYSIVLPSSFSKKRGVKGSYRYLCRFLIRFYERIGLQARFAGEDGSGCNFSNVCLAGREAYDILVDGKKIGGNAQRHCKNAMLQHGSIPLKLDKKLFDPLFIEDSGLERAAALEDFGIVINYEEAVRTIMDIIVETFDIEAVHDKLHENEIDRSYELLEKRYDTNRWTIHGTK